jgi:hypothetical protein
VRACVRACARSLPLPLSLSRALFPVLSLALSLHPAFLSPAPSLSLSPLASFSPARRSVLGSLYSEESTLIYADQHFKGRKEIMVSFFFVVIFFNSFIQGPEGDSISCDCCVGVCVSVCPFCVCKCAHTHPPTNANAHVNTHIILPPPPIQACMRSYARTHAYVHIHMPCLVSHVCICI